MNEPFLLNLQSPPQDADLKMVFYVASDPMVITAAEKKDRDFFNGQAKEFHKVELDQWRKGGGRMEGKPKPLRARWTVSRKAPMMELYEKHSILDNVSMDHFTPASEFFRQCFAYRICA